MRKEADKSKHALEAAHSAAEGTERELNAQIETLATETQTLSDELDTARNELRKVQSQSKAAAGASEAREVAALKAKLATAEATVAELEAESTQLAALVVDVKREREELLSTTATLQDETDTLKAELQFQTEAAARAVEQGQAATQKAVDEVNVTVEQLRAIVSISSRVVTAATRPRDQFAPKFTKLMQFRSSMHRTVTKHILAKTR